MPKGGNLLYYKPCFTFLQYVDNSDSAFRGENNLPLNK